MPDHVIDSSINNQVSLNSGDDLEVTYSGAITTSGISVLARGNNTISVRGTVSSTDGMAIDLKDPSQFDLWGSVSGKTIAVSITSSTNTVRSIVNHGGNIISGGTAILGDGLIKIENLNDGANRAVIAGANIGINLAANSTGRDMLDLVNSGDIRGGSLAIQGSDGDDKIQNSGMIEGLSGRAIALGYGDDLYDGKAGTAVGIIDMGVGDDTVYGGSGNETIVAGLGDDSIDGGGGIDTLQFVTEQDLYLNLGRDTPYENGDGTDTIKGIENVIGGSGYDEITGSDDVNHLIGGEGDDTLDGAGGIDRLEGGSGDDTYYISDATDDMIVELADGGYDMVRASRSYVLADGVSIEEMRAVDGDADIDLTGNDLSHVLLGNMGRNVIRGGVGDDSLFGAAGDDTLIDLKGGKDTFDGSIGHDTVSYYAVDDGNGIEVYMHGGKANRGAAEGDTYISIDVIDATNYNDTLEGNNDDNGFWGANGNDDLKGFSGNDTLSAGDGNDILDGGSGNDTLYGDNGSDFLSGAAGGDDKFYGGNGTDTVSYFLADKGVAVYLGHTQDNTNAAAGDSYDGIEVIDGTFQKDTLEGAGDNDAFWGAAGEDILRGHSGDDILKGGAGDDLLEGGAGRDELHGNEGSDTYMVDAADVIVEKAGEGTDTLIASASYILASQADVEILKAGETAGSIDLTGNGIGNVFHGNRSANRVDGGGGNDTVVLTGKRSDYTVTLNKDGSVTLADKRANGDGTDVIHNIEIFQFADSKLSLAGVVDQSLLSGDVVAENSAVGIDIGEFLASAKTGGPLRYELVTNAEGRFQIDAATGRLKVANGVKLDYEQADRHTIAVRVTDASGASVDKNVTILVQDVLNERAIGSPEADGMRGGAGQDYFASMQGDDWIEAGLGNDTLSGGLGKDLLTGGEGKDMFVFDTKANKRTNVDKIVDFKVKDDTIWLDNAVFTKLGSGTELKPKKFKADMFVKGKKAQDAEDRIIYDKKTGSLYYDPDGTGSKAQVKVATLSKNLKMTHNDFFVI